MNRRRIPWLLVFAVVLAALILTALFWQQLLALFSAGLVGRVFWRRLHPKPRTTSSSGRSKKSYVGEALLIGAGWWFGRNRRRELQRVEQRKRAELDRRYGEVPF